MLKIKSIKFTNDPVFKNKEFDFTTKANNVADVVVIVGKNGSGKSRLINILEQLTYFIFSDHHKLINKITGSNINHFSHKEIEQYKDFFLNASSYDIEYEYTFLDSEKILLERLNIYDKDKLEHINCYLKDKVNLKINIETNWNWENKEIKYQIKIKDAKLLNNTDDKINDLIFHNINDCKDKDEHCHRFILGSLFTQSRYTHFFDTLNELITRTACFKDNVINYYANKLDEYEDKNEKEDNKNPDFKIMHSNYSEHNYNFEELLIKFYNKEIESIKSEYIFDFKQEIKLSKLENYINSINEFLKKSSKNKSYLQIYKIFDNNVYFKKDDLNSSKINEIFSWKDLSAGEKQILNQSIYLLNLLKDDTTNKQSYTIDNQNNIYENNLDKFINGTYKINTIYFIDEIELSFHPTWISNILNFLKKSLKDSYGQMFITTHSELIPYSINIEKDTLINMDDVNNEDNESTIISFKKW